MDTLIHDDEHDAPSRGRYLPAYQAVRAAAQALPESEVAHISVKIGVLMSEVTSKLVAIEALRPRVMRACPCHDMDNYDALAQRAFAMRWAHSLYQTAVDEPVQYKREVLALRHAQTRLKVQLAAWAVHGLLPPMRPGVLKSAVGYQQLISNVLHLIVHLRNHWTEHLNVGAIRFAELDDFEKQAENLMLSLARRVNDPSEVREAADMRNRMFTLLLRSIKSVRKAAVLLIDDPAERARIVPNVYRENGSWARGGKKRRKVKSEAAGG